MKIKSSLLLFGFVSIIPFSQQIVAQKDNAIRFDSEIEALMSRMTLKEKVGQMTQLTLDAVCYGKPFDGDKIQKIDPEKLKRAILEYKVGSIINTGLYTLTREQWHLIIKQIQDEANKNRLKIPILYGIDAIHGANYTVGSTLFPQEIALAATWDPNFAEKMASITAYEVRASATPWNFSPVLDLGRQPLWSRFFETFGEDPYLASRMGAAMIKGYQGTDVSNPTKVAACLKHFMGYSNSKTGKDRTPILMSERELREYYLEPFRAAINEGAQSVMINSSEINGVPVHSDYHILTEILKEELQFDGIALTDWLDISNLHTEHKIAVSEKDAVEIAINAGVDMSMTPFTLDFADYLVELVNEGKVPISRVNDAVKRILNVKYRLGLFKQAIYPIKDYPKFGSKEFADVSYNAALESITLLKNNNYVLPLKKDTKILLTGASANSLNYLNGAWTHTWGGVIENYNTPGKKTILQALTESVAAGNLIFSQGTDFNKDINTSETILKAKDVEYIVICLGENPSTEKAGDIEDLNYPTAQIELVKQLSKMGKPIIGILLSARPRIFNEIEPYFSAILHAYLPGNEGGRAIAATLFGDNNPSGKLPYTYPRHSGSIVLYDHKFTEKKDLNYGLNAFNPQYEFGFGLSYTTFEYSNFNVSSSELNQTDSIVISIDIKNTGSRYGKEVIQLYSRDHFASITPCVRKLRKFTKVELASGETKKVTFTVTKNDLNFVNKNLQWVTENGKFDLMIDNMIIEIEYKE